MGGSDVKGVHVLPRCHGNTGSKHMRNNESRVESRGDKSRRYSEQGCMASSSRNVFLFCFQLFLRSKNGQWEGVKGTELRRCKVVHRMKPPAIFKIVSNL